MFRNLCANSLYVATTHSQTEQRAEWRGLAREAARSLCRMYLTHPASVSGALLAKPSRVSGGSHPKSQAKRSSDVQERRCLRLIEKYNIQDKEWQADLSQAR